MYFFFFEKLNCLHSVGLPFLWLTSTLLLSQATLVSLAAGYKATVLQASPYLQAENITI